MFELRTDLHEVPLKGESVLEVYASVNQPQIAAEDVDAQEASAYVVTGQTASGFGAFIFLWMRVSNRALIYGWDEPILRDDYQDVRDAGMQFTESMGFMMEDLMIRRHGATERKRILEALPVFAPLSGGGAVVEEPAPEAAVEEVLILDEGGLPPDESILILPADMPTQVGYRPATSDNQSVAGGSSDPLDDKNLKVFLRLLASA